MLPIPSIDPITRSSTADPAPVFGIVSPSTLDDGLAVSAGITDPPDDALAEGLALVLPDGNGRPLPPPLELDGDALGEPE